MIRSSLASIFAIALTCQAFGLDSVPTDAGPVSGVEASEGSDVTVFRGIPFAAPPVGELRWQPPQPVESWEETRVCDTFGPISWQGKNQGKCNEDCLYLNVWTPKEKPAEKLPVMVWIHGGGLRSGSGSLKNYDGEEFAKRGVVLVTINYRLGALGYFAHPELSKESSEGVSGNYGFLDQIAALKWVQRNIEAFGGDKDRVTIFGESAGGTSVFVLGASPLAKGLFHRSILQSAWLDPGIFQPLSAADGEPNAEAAGAEIAAKVLGANGKLTKDVLAQLRALPAKQILDQLKGGSPVTIDGHFLPKHPELIFAEGSHNQVPTIAGTNRDEGTMFAGGAAGLSVEQFEKRTQQVFGESTDTVLEFYQVEENKQVLPTTVQMITDGWFVQPTRRYARAIAKSDGKAWMYHFERVSPNWTFLGAAHAAEIVFVFNTLNESKMKGANKEIAEAMISYWVQFAKTGDPNVEGFHAWPAYNAADEKHLVIDAEFKVESKLRCEACEMLDSIRTLDELKVSKE
ncbi:MAG: carboxylesterase family protein [Planctomycetota bacterium]